MKDATHTSINYSHIASYPAKNERGDVCCKFSVADYFQADGQSNKYCSKHLPNLPVVSIAFLQLHFIQMLANFGVLSTCQNAMHWSFQDSHHSNLWSRKEHWLSARNHAGITDNMSVKWKGTISLYLCQWILTLYICYGLRNLYSDYFVNHPPNFSSFLAKKALSSPMTCTFLFPEILRENTSSMHLEHHINDAA